MTSRFFSTRKHSLVDFYHFLCVEFFHNKKKIKSGIFNQDLGLKEGQIRKQKSKSLKMKHLVQRQFL